MELGIIIEPTFYEKDETPSDHDPTPLPRAIVTKLGTKVIKRLSVMGVYWTIL